MPRPITLRLCLGMLLLLRAFAQEESIPAVQVQISPGMRAPLPEGFEVLRMASSATALWFQGLDHSGDTPDEAVIQWSAAGIRRMRMPQSDSSVPIVTVDLFTDAVGDAYLLTNRGVYQAEREGFRYRSDFADTAVKAITGRSEFWLITTGDEVYHLAVLHGSAARRKAAGIGTIDASALSAFEDLWVGTRTADGVHLRRIGREGVVETLKVPGGARITAIHADETDLVWFAVADGRVGQYRAGAVDWIYAPSGVRHSAIDRIVEDRNGNQYLVQDSMEQEQSSVLIIPLSRQMPGQAGLIRARLSNLKGSVRTGFVDSLDGVWVSVGRHGAFRLQGLQELNWPHGPVQEQLGVVTHAVALKSTLSDARKLAEPSTGITALPGGKFAILNTSRGMANNTVSCITSDTDGSVYFTTGYENQGDDPAASGGGITRFDHRLVTNYTAANGLASNTVQACAADPARNLVWFGTTNGLTRFNPATSTFTNFLPGQKVQDVVVHGNNVWVATFSNGVYRLDAATGNQLNQYGAGNNKVISIVVDQTGTVWAGTSGSGLYTLGTSFTLVTAPAAPSGIIQDLEVDASNNLWVSVWNAGVYRRTPGGTATLFTSANGLGGVFAGVHRTYRIERDAANNLWFSHGAFGQVGTPAAAVTFLSAAHVNAAAPAFIRYTTANGFPTNLVLALYSEDPSTIWFGSPGGGAWRLGGPADAAGWPQPLAGSVFFNSPLLVDLDGNRNLEVVVGDNSGKIYAFRPNGTTLWTYDTRNAFPGQTTGAMSIQSSVAAGDVDGDGEIELVVGLGGQVINGTIGQGGVLILSRLGTFERVLHTYDITDAGRTRAPGDGFREGVFATPLLANVDSDPELEIMAGAFDNLIYAWNGDGSPIYRKDNDGDGRFDEDFLGDFTPYTPFNLSDDFPGIRFVDDDGDGLIDEGSPSDDDEDGRVDEDYPEWPFNARDTVVTSAAAFDFYGTGQKSLIFGHDYSGDELFNRGGVLRVFTPQGEAMPGFPKGNLEQVIWSSPVVVDLDNDGAHEIIHGSGLDLSTVGNAPTDALVGQLVYAWRRDGTSFKAGTNGRLATTEGRSWASFAVGDLDNDGSPELVVATTSLRNKQNQYINQSGAVVADSAALGQKVYVYDTSGNLKPGFPVRPYTAIAGANLIGSPVLADVDSDGFLDIIIPVGPGLIVLDRHGRGVSGMGIFENLQDLGYAGEVNGTPAVGDIDLDGRLELVWTQGTGNGSTSIVRVVKLGAVNSTVQRSWPMWRRSANRNAVFGPLVGLAQVYETAGTLNFSVEGFAGRNAVSSVTVNLATIGGPSSFALTDNGSNADPVANDGWFSGSFSIGAVAAGKHSLPVTVRDSAGRSDTQPLIYARQAPGSPPGCTFSVTPTSRSGIAYTGLKGTFTVTASSPACGWTVTSNRSWAQVYPLAGTGNGTVQYTVFPNFSTTSRSAVFSVMGATFHLTQNAGIGTPNQRFVAQIYFNILGRLPSQSEIDLQTNTLASGTPRENLVLNFFDSPEFNLGGRFVAGLYVGLLDRNAEYSGWLFQRNAMSTGIVNPNELVGNFIGSQEYILKFGSPSNEDFVRLLYRKVLLREPSPSEVQLQSNALASGTTRIQLATAFLNSKEFRQGTGPRLTAFLLYALLLQRDPTVQERSAREAQIAGGADVRTLIEELINSTEFSALLQ